MKLFDFGVTAIIAGYILLVCVVAISSEALDHDGKQQSEAVPPAIADMG